MIKIEKNLYQGNLDDAIEASKNKTVDAIVYLGQELPRKLSHESKIPVIHIPMKDGENEEILVHLALLNIGFLETDDKTLVACRAGISRSPIIITAYLATYHYARVDFDRAYNRVKRLIPSFNPEQNLLAIVKKVVESYRSVR